MGGFSIFGYKRIGADVASWSEGDMKDLIEYIARNLVDDPEGVQVKEHRGDYVIRVQLQVADEDKGKVIGREGKIARALRTIVNATASREGKRGILEIE